MIGVTLSWFRRTGVQSIGYAFEIDVLLIK